MSDTILNVSDLHASYGPLSVLRGLNFEVNEGQVVVILGANGAGKTTTLRSICQMCDTEGSITLRGTDISSKGTADIIRLGVGHVPQGRGTFAELSVIDNLLIGSYTRSDDGVQADIDRWFEMFPILAERRDQLAGSLSGGEQQMLAVARALMSRPELLLLDEPSLGLAPIIVEQLFETLQRLNKEDGLTMLLVEQNANLALSMADHGYVIESGLIALEGSAQALMTDPAVQAAYLGA